MLKLRDISKEGDIVRVVFEAEVPIAFFRDAASKRLSRQQILAKVKQWLLNRLQGGI